MAIIITPGPNSLLMVQQSLMYGKAASVFNALGSVIASLLLMVISSIGLQMILTSQILNVLSVIGALYLIYMGIVTVRSRYSYHVSSNKNAKIVSRFKFFKDAFWVGMSNPKDILFFLIFMPQFIDQHINFISSLVMLMCGWLVCDFSIMLFYGFLAYRIKDLSHQKIQLVSKISGGIIVLIGASILIKTLYLFIV